MTEAGVQSRWRVYFYAVVFAALVVLLRMFAMRWMDRQPFLPIFLIPVIFTAYMGGLRPGLFATLLAGLSTKLLVFAPYGTFTFSTPRDVALWLSLLLAGVIVSVLFEELQQWRRKETEDQAEPRRANMEKKVRVGFAISLAFLGVIAIASYLSVARFSQAAALMRHSQSVVTTIDALVESVLEMEAAERLYVVRGDGATAPDYPSVNRRTDELLRELREAVDSRPAQLQRALELAEAVRARIRFSAQLVEMRQAQGLPAVQEFLASGVTPTGAPGRTRVHAVASEMKRAERRILETSERAALAGAKSTQLIIVGGGGLALMFVALALYAIRRDLRARERAEAELNRFFELTIDIFTIATPDGRFKRVSPAFEDILGYTVEEALKLDYMKMQHPDDVGRTRDVVERQSKRGEKVEHFEARFRHKDGTYRVLSWRSQPYGGLFYATARDVTAATAAAEALRESNERLEERVAARTRELASLNEALQRAYDDLRTSQQQVMQQERLRALGQMASGIAHDINNAISPVALYTEALLAHETSLSDRARSQLEIIQRAVDDIAQTVARMGEFYRQREQPLTPVELNSLVGQVIALTRARWSDMAQQRGAAVDMHTELGGNLPPVAAIESQIRDALVNLVFNAVDAMPEGGRLTVRTRLETGGEAPAVVLEVEDQGVGMDEDTRRRCCEPFFTTKGERGTGLGLAMVYGIAQRHGAKLEIESEPGKGTLIRLRFPLPAGS